MDQDDSMKRPTMDEVVTRFSEIRGNLNTWKLRSCIVRKYEFWPVTARKSVGHWYFALATFLVALYHLLLLFVTSFFVDVTIVPHVHFHATAVTPAISLVSPVLE